MNRLTSSQRSLLEELLDYLKDVTIINDKLDMYLETTIKVILKVNTYTDSEKMLLNGLRELYMIRISKSNDEVINDVDDKFEIW